MTKTCSTSPRISSSTEAGVAGLMATPARLPRALILCTVRCRLALPSQWTRRESDPASAKASRNASGSDTIRCVSSGRRVTRRTDCTTAGPIERLGTKCPSMTSTWMRSAPARSASVTCSPRRAKSAARIEGASRTRSLRSGTGFLEDVHELVVPAGDLGDGLLSGRLFAPPADQWLPEVGAADREPDEARDSGGGHQPLAHLLLVLAPAEDDAADAVPAVAARGGDDPLAVLATVEPFDLPDVRLDSGILELADRLDHQSWPELQVVGLLVALEQLELRLLRRHQQLEHEPAPPLAVQVFGEPPQTSGLPPVQRLIAFRVVANENLAEGRVEHFDVPGEIFAVLEVELRLAALLGRARRGVSLCRRGAKDGGAELLVHEDAGFLLGDAGYDGALEAVVDHLLGGRDLRGLLGGQGPFPAEHLGLERPPMIEGQDVQVPIESDRHRTTSRSLKRRMRPFVD